MIDSKRSVIQHIEKQGWKYSEEDNFVRMNLKTEEMDHCLVFSFNGEGIVSLFELHPQNVSEEKRCEVAEYLTRANYGIVIGNFEMDFSDGEIRYKVAIDVEGGMLTELMVGDMLIALITHTEAYYAGLMAVQFANVKPAEAIESIKDLFVSDSSVMGLEDVTEDAHEHMIN